MSHTISVSTTMDGPGFHDFAVFDAFHHRKAWLRPAIFAAIMLAFAAVCLSQLSKRPGAGLLAAGLFLGTLCPPGILPWSPKQDPQVNRVFSNLTVTDAANFAVSGQDSSSAPAQFNSKDNFLLLDSACSAALAMQQRDWDALSSLVHPELGVTFTPYSTVEPDVDQNFSAKQIRKLCGI